MKDNKSTLFVIIVTDLLIILGSFFVIRDRVNTHKKLLNQKPPVSQQNYTQVTRKPETKPEPEQEKPKQAGIPIHKPVTPPSPPKTEPAKEPKKETKTATSTTPRNILFTYRNSIPKAVEIIGDFNEWEPQPMTKGDNHTWSIMMKLLPGYYTYNYIVDGKVIRDPNNPRTAPGDRSLLHIKPLGSSE